MDILIPWDGVFCGYRYTRPEGLEIAPDGCIYYTDAGGDKCVWCAPSRLLRHMVHLYQISHRRQGDAAIVELISD